MVAKVDQDRIKTLVEDTLILLIKNGLNHKYEFAVNALIGITVDKENVFLINVNETIERESPAINKSIAAKDTEADFLNNNNSDVDTTDAQILPSPHKSLKTFSERTSPRRRKRKQPVSRRMIQNSEETSIEIEDGEEISTDMDISKVDGVDNDVPCSTNGLDINPSDKHSNTDSSPIKVPKVNVTENEVVAIKEETRGENYDPKQLAFAISSQWQGLQEQGSAANWTIPPETTSTDSNPPIEITPQNNTSAQESQAFENAEMGIPTPNVGDMTQDDAERYEMLKWYLANGGVMYDQSMHKGRDNNTDSAATPPASPKSHPGMPKQKHKPNPVIYIDQSPNSASSPEGDKNFTCNICGKFFTKQANFKLHLDLHRGKYRYNCGYCNKGMSSITSLKEHEFRHTSKPGFTCKLCNQPFVKFMKMKDHLRAVHGC